MAEILNAEYYRGKRNEYRRLADEADRKANEANASGDYAGYIENVLLSLRYLCCCRDTTAKIRTLQHL